MKNKKKWYLQENLAENSYALYGPYNQLEIEWIKELSSSPKETQVNNYKIIEYDFKSKVVNFFGRSFYYILICLFIAVILLYGFYLVYQKTHPLYPKITISFMQEQVHKNPSIVLQYPTLKENLPYLLRMESNQLKFTIQGVLDKSKNKMEVKKWIYDQGVDLTPGLYKAYLKLFPYGFSKYINYSQEYELRLEFPKKIHHELVQRYHSLKYLVEKIRQEILLNQDFQAFEQAYTNQYATFLRDLSLKPLEHYSKEEQDKIMHHGKMIGEKMVDLLDSWRLEEKSNRKWDALEYTDKHLVPLIDLLNSHGNSY